jgi:hypothetical protein
MAAWILIAGGRTAAAQCGGAKNRSHAQLLMPRWGVDSKVLRKATIETLSLLVERYPNLPVCAILSNATGFTCLASDEELARGLNQLFISFTQLEAAGIMKHG